MHLRQTVMHCIMHAILQHLLQIRLHDLSRIVSTPTSTQFGFRRWSILQIVQYGPEPGEHLRAEDVAQEVRVEVRR